MSTAQKIIKYCAIAFACFLIYMILSSIMFGISSLLNIFDDDTNTTNNLEETIIKEEKSIIDVEIASSELKICEGDSFKVETNNKYIQIKESNKKLYIKEKKHNIFSNNNKSSIIIYIPKDLVFDSISIESGAGKIDISSLITKELDLNLGAGNVNIDNLFVESEAEIDGGAGKLTIENGTINNLDLDMGVGAVNIKSKLTGNNNIDAGVGEIILNLIGTKDDYKIITDKGIGNIKVDNEDIKENTYYGNGSTIIDIDGGVGNITVNYKQNKTI